MKTTYWIGVIVILVVVLIGAYWYALWRTGESEVTVVPVTNTSPKESTASTDTNKDNSTQVKVIVDTITLDSVGNYTGSGVATRIFANGTFTHTLSAKITDPASGKFYEGWLVNMSLTPKFFSTGKLKKENGEYKLTFTNNKEYTKYSDIIITEETEANGLDGVPEAHVLEGTFPN